MHHLADTAAGASSVFPCKKGDYVTVSSWGDVRTICIYFVPTK